MRRFSVPTDDALFQEFDKKVPDGVKAVFIRGLIRIGLGCDKSVMWDVIANENGPGKFVIIHLDDKKEQPE